MYSIFTAASQLMYAVKPNRSRFLRTGKSSVPTVRVGGTGSLFIRCDWLFHIDNIVKLKPTRSVVDTT
jgi:hypothetical protein